MNEPHLYHCRLLSKHIKSVCYGEYVEAKLKIILVWRIIERSFCVKGNGEALEIHSQMLNMLVIDCNAFTGENVSTSQRWSEKKEWKFFFYDELRLIDWLLCWAEIAFATVPANKNVYCWLLFELFEFYLSYFRCFEPFEATGKFTASCKWNEKHEKSI